MSTITVILGENGKGKTRYLLDYFHEYIDKKQMAVISNALINPFPRERTRINHMHYALRAGNSYNAFLFERNINSYFLRLLRQHKPYELFSILKHVGFDDDFIVRRQALYQVNKRIDSHGEEIFELVSSPYGKRRYPTGEQTYKLTRGFADTFVKFLEVTEEFNLNYFNHDRQNQIYSDHLEFEASLKKKVPEFKHRPLFETRLYFKKKGKYFPIEKASSGELHILTLGLFVQQFIRDSPNSNLQKVLLIDEPENSLHPKWQREYIPFIQGFIGYNNVKVIIATHSPLIAMENEGFSEGITLRTIEDGVLLPIQHKKSDNNIEQIYYELFGVLTPKNRYLSEYCNNLLKRYTQDKVSYGVALNALEGLRQASFDEKQTEFLNGVIEILEKLGRGHIND